MMPVRVSVVLAALALAAPALAADLAPPVEPVPIEQSVPVFSWTGPYAGLRGGVGFLQGDFSIPGASASENISGGLLGGFVGANYQMDNIVVGIEGNLNYNWNKTDIDVIGTDTEVKSDVSGSVVGRLGYAMDQTLFFATAGWAATRVGIDTAAGSEDRTFNGWTVGAGIDYAFSDTLFGRAEYSYNNFGTERIQGTDVDLDEHVVTAGIGMKF